jgi:hypothetical protein
MHNTGADAEQKPAYSRSWLWQPGQSGNPDGKRSTKLRREKLMAELSAEFGGLSGGDHALLSEAVDLLVKRSGDRVRTINTAARIIRDIRRRHLARAASQPTIAPLAELLRRERAT